jgi:hypothetical protein
MPLLVHLTSEKNVRHILRSGIKEAKYRGVYCMPVLPNYYISHQWLRELKRNGQRTYVAVYFRVSDQEIVSFGRYNQKHAQIPLSEAIQQLMTIADPLGYEMILSRTVRPQEIQRVRHIRQVMGWRYMPHAHGKPFCRCSYCIGRGQIKGRGVREP